MCQNERGTKKADSSHLKNVSFTFLHQGISSPVNIRLISIVIWKKGVYVTNSRLITWLYFLNVYVCVCLNIIGEKMLFSVYDCFGSVLIISSRCHAGAQDKQKENNLEKKSRVVVSTFQALSLPLTTNKLELQRIEIYTFFSPPPCRPPCLHSPATTLSATGWCRLCSWQSSRRWRRWGIIV